MRLRGRVIKTRTTKQRVSSQSNVRRAHMARVRTHEPRSPGRVRPLRRR